MMLLRSRFFEWPLLGLMVVALAAALTLPTMVRAQDGTPLVAAIEERLDLETTLPQGADGQRELLAIREFYEARGFEPAWVGPEGATDRGRSLVEVIGSSALDGLVPANYAIETLTAGQQASDAAALAEFEYILTRSLVHFGRDLSAGRVQPNKVNSEVFIYPDPVESLQLLTTLASSADPVGYLAALAPQSANYARLKAALADYRRIEQAGGWSKLPDGETLKPEMRDPQIALLRSRLMEAGDLEAESADPEFFDPDLEAAVKRFQYRHGLDQDGAVGKMTRAALNVPVSVRIDQMLLNMERRRWMPDDLGRTYVFVNLADFVLKVVDGPKTIYDSRVVVGKPYHRTPVFSGEMSYMVINPYWHVPPSIARNEILPAVLKDPGYLRKKNFKVFSSWGSDASVLNPSSVNWQSIAQGKLTYKFRQEPGDGNALGRIKFMFPNQFNVYLHDTPSKSLFARTVRSFSHGCIRVQNPANLAEVLLRNMDGWSMDSIQSAIASKKRQIVRLDEVIPVHLTYLTAWVNKDSSVHFRDDIYGRDKRLRQALERSNASGRVGE